MKGMSTTMNLTAHISNIEAILWFLVTIVSKILSRAPAPHNIIKEPKILLYIAYPLLVCWHNISNNRPVPVDCYYPGVIQVRLIGGLFGSLAGMLHLSDCLSSTLVWSQFYLAELPPEATPCEGVPSPSLPHRSAISKGSVNKKRILEMCVSWDVGQLAGRSCLWFFVDGFLYYRYFLFFFPYLSRDPWERRGCGETWAEQSKRFTDQEGISVSVSFPFFIYIVTSQLSLLFSFNLVSFWYYIDTAFYILFISCLLLGASPYIMPLCSSLLILI